jgi:hypothetical protein
MLLGPAAIGVLGCADRIHVIRIPSLVPHEPAVEDAMRHLVEPSLTELLEEPIVRQLMTRDAISERQVRAIAAAARRRIEQQRRSLSAVGCASLSLQTGHTQLDRG